MGWKIGDKVVWDFDRWHSGAHANASWMGDGPFEVDDVKPRTNPPTPLLHLKGDNQIQTWDAAWFVLAPADAVPMTPKYMATVTSPSALPSSSP